MEEINHFSHKNHPLKQTIVGDISQLPGAIACYACEKPISSSGFAYACIQCHYFLHKSCAQLPPTINHHSLYRHPLTLVDYRTTPFGSWSCEVCRSHLLTQGFCYSFTKDNNKLYFTACIACCVIEIARKAQLDAIKKEAMIKIEHEGHPDHTLTLQTRHATFCCDACSVTDEGLFYQCDSCDFWIHKTCASLAPTIDLPHHPHHQLLLVYSLPENFSNFSYYCEFCNIYIRWNVWLYHCANCRYFVHIKCALNAKQPSTTRDDPSTSVADEDEHDLLHFPMSNAFTNPLKLLYLEKTGEDDDETSEVNHWSHDHPLLLNVKPEDHMFGDQIEVCQGCVRPLSHPFYTCKYGCSFTLHKYCAKLPLKLQHPLHPDHSLDLINTYGDAYYFRCFGCSSYGNTFMYKCVTCKFYLDVNCAFLPNIIRHKSHAHPLTQVINPKSLCNACDKFSHFMSFACKDCNFILGMHCAMRSPYTLGHRYCKGHEISLTYPPIIDHVEDFYCDICEIEMHPKFPLYYCHKCKNSFHIPCISRIDSYANIYHKGTTRVYNHKHPLTFVRRKKTPKYVCSSCNCDINGYLVLECRARVCSFNICYTCFRNSVDVLSLTM